MYELNGEWGDSLHNLCVFSDIGEQTVLTEKKVKVFGIEKVAKNTRKALGAIWKMDPIVSTWSLIRVAALAFCHHYIFYLFDDIEG